MFTQLIHIQQSLLSAFSLCIKQKNEDCSLILDNKKDNLSVVDVFNKVDIETTLYSTQGSLGGHNLANKFVFNTKNKYFSSDVRIDNEKNSSKFLGNRYNPDFDDAKYFEKSFCKNKKSLVTATIINTSPFLCGSRAIRWLPRFYFT